jgi:hypothetical protein
LALAQAQLYADVPKPAVHFAKLYAKRTNAARLSLHQHCPGKTAWMDGCVDVWMVLHVSIAGIGKASRRYNVRSHVESFGAAG